MYARFKVNLIRHGESEVNVQPDIMGQSSDILLTKNGEEQAKKLGKRFIKEGIIYDYVFSSTYTRALNTAQLALPNECIRQYPDLREYSAGQWEGCSRKEIITQSVINEMNYHNANFQPPGGESLTQVEFRAAKWLEDTILYNQNLSSLSQSKPLNIAVFSHGMTIKCLIKYIMGFDKSMIWKVNIDNTAISSFSFGERGWVVHSINDVGHLK